PYEYVYFNRSFGGLPAASQRYETDYWGASYREGFTWALAHVAPNPARKLTIATCKQDPQLDYYLTQLPGAAERFELARKPESAEIYLAFTRGPCAKSTGKLLHQVKRQDTTLLNVLDRRGIKQPAKKPKKARAR
ncbi:MAG: hypothetical protein ABW321_26210, partial [Polyangiales bacterium]